MLNGASPTFVFQFQYGAIKGITSPLSPGSLYSFNSSMVRLKESMIMANSNHWANFQFQYGAIKGFIYNNEYYIYYNFQFQYGAIKGFLNLSP